MWCTRRREGACQPFYCLPRCGCRRCLLPFLRFCGLLTRCFGEGVAALIVHGILILVSRSGDIEREGFAALLFYLSSLPDGQFYTNVLLGTSVGASGIAYGCHWQSHLPTLLCSFSLSHFSID
ncbi:hypothetical protein TcCL_Unassigned03486 [Trypanosoma cruzi]|nr:hypothetical protein TcCL_Unassigned03486 [Trypanosoma cruzi]